MMPSTNDRRDEIKLALSYPLQVCGALGLLDGHKKQAKGLLIRCPSHGENNPSCSVTVEQGTIRVKCFACSLSGDVFNLVAAVHQLDVGRDFTRILEIAGELAGIQAPDQRRSSKPPLKSVPAPTTPEAPDLTAEWNALQPVSSDCREYLQSRDLVGGAEMCRTATSSSPGELGRLAAEGYVLAQALRDPRGRVVAIQLRQITAKGFRVVGPTSAGLFGSPEKVKAAAGVVLCEGFTDTLAASAVYAGDEKTAVVGIAGVQAAQAIYQLELAGKRVLVALDADEAGDKAAAAITTELVKRKARPTRARPEHGKDLAEMLEQGEDLRDFFRHAATGFQSVATGVTREREERQAQVGKFLTFGVDFLDRALGGIFPDDLVLLGAATGKGKTEMATAIARENVLAGKRVHYLALEAGRLEIERRLKYPLISTLVYEDRHRNCDLWKKLNYLDWYMGRLDSQLDRYERSAEATIRTKYPSLYVRYKGGDRFDSWALRQSILDVADDSDLTVVDHLMYIDSDEPNENRATKLTVQVVRDLQGRTGKPVLLVVHIRKADRSKKKPALVPHIDDIHGTSDTGKIGTKAILIAPAYDQPVLLDDYGVPQRHLALTYIDPTKCRIDGSRTRFVGLVPFNFRLGKYQPTFEVGKLIEDRTKFVFIRKDEELPDWAIENRQPELLLPEPPPPPRAYRTVQTSWTDPERA